MVHKDHSIKNEQCRVNSTPAHDLHGSQEADDPLRSQCSSILLFANLVSLKSCLSR